jgi:hypothetical protein
VGKILLDELIKNKELIKENKLFVALINDKINYYESKNSYKFAENQVLEETL